MNYQEGLQLRVDKRRFAFDSDTEGAVRSLAKEHPQWSALEVYEEVSAICPRCCGPMTGKEISKGTKVCKDLECGLEVSYSIVSQLLARRRC